MHGHVVDLHWFRLFVFGEEVFLLDLFFWGLVLVVKVFDHVSVVFSAVHGHEIIGPTVFAAKVCVHLGRPWRCP